eukprot:gene30091-35055_t
MKPNQNSNTVEETAQEAFEKVFTNVVKKQFTDLTKQGMDPNEACSLALKIASGMEIPPMSTQSSRRFGRCL